jgi:uncharacterized protein (DUF2147 family)
MKFTAATLAAAIAFSSAAAAAPQGPEGTWRATNGKITVKIEYCDQPKLCATIVALKKPLDKQGNPKLDRENPNPALRSRPVIGLQIMSGMIPESGNRWQGEIYNADDGNTYAATAKFENNRLQVKGCLLFICKKLRFVRVQDVSPTEAKIQ